MNFKRFYWFTLRTRCPNCHSKLIKRGFVKDGFLQAYQCENCGWGS